MNIFEEVKERSDILDVANIVGLTLNKQNKCLCPFHNEKTPSFSISKKKQIFKCFGCGEAGDTIALVSKIKGITPYESALYINDTLNLGIEISNHDSKEFSRKVNNKNTKISNYNNSKIVLKAFKKWENDTFLLLSDYRRKISEMNSEETEDVLNLLDYYLDIFTKDDIDEKLDFYKNNMKVVQDINDRYIKKDN